MITRSENGEITPASDRWEALEDAFIELNDTYTAFGGCDAAFFRPEWERLTVLERFETLESRSNFSLVSRLIANITPADSVGSRTRLLLRRYKSMRGLVQAAMSDIRQDGILTELERSVLRTVRDASANFLRECAMSSPQVRNYAELQDYLRLSLATEQAEMTRLLLLDREYNIIADEFCCFGALYRGEAFQKKVVVRTVAHDTAALIIVHNHPSGEPEPTRNDLIQTKRLAFVLDELGMRLYDHVVVGRRAVLSLRRLGMFDDNGSLDER